MEGFFSFIKTIFKIGFTTLRVMVYLVILLPILALTISFIFASSAKNKPPEFTIASETALILAPEGNIVEQLTYEEPIIELINKLSQDDKPREETLLQDILDVIHEATVDDRIKVMVIVPEKIKSISMNQLMDIGRAIDNFKASGKETIAIGSNFNQAGYFLAAQADKIFLNPMGKVDLHGFSLYRLYVKELIDKLKVNFHVFKVGAYKSALEPFFRTDMSDEAREANKMWLNNLWQIYVKEISKKRNFDEEKINDIINNYHIYLKQSKGNSGDLALRMGLVDELKTYPQIRKYLQEKVGSKKHKGIVSYNNVNLYQYMSTLTPSYTTDYKEPSVGIITARGVIVDGKGEPGQIGAKRIVQQIRRAADDKNIKALVLRVDSGGGSAFASELIRNELINFKESGKPLVISMASLAASGAYWISADADKILSYPSTLTGSIGVFGAIPTFEESLAEIGVTSDGISTTQVSGKISLTRPLDNRQAQTIQQEVENIYQRFIDIVSTGRKMSQSKVKQLAQGRVWTGEKALELGLVDEFGSLKEAVNQAADLAKIKPIGVYVRQGDGLGDFLTQIIKQLESSVVSNLRVELPLSQLEKQRKSWTEMFVNNRDPQNIYAHSMLPLYPVSD